MLRCLHSHIIMGIRQMDKVGFSWVTPVLCVSDLLQSLTYYQQVLGFELSWQWSEHGEFAETSAPTFACVNRGEISLFLSEKHQGKPGAWLCLNVSHLAELERLYQEYQAASARIIEAPQNCPWGMREMLVEDLDGNTFRIGCLAEPEQGSI